MDAYSCLAPEVDCYNVNKIKIGDYSMLANDVAIIGGDHIYDLPDKPIIFSGRDQLNATIIGKMFGLELM